MKFIPSNSQDLHFNIQKEAYLIAAKSGFRTNSNEAWLNAEKKIRNRIFCQNLSKKEFGGCLAKDFFRRVNLSEINDASLASEYLKLFIGDNKEYFRKFSKIQSSIDSIEHISVLLDNSSIENTTRKTLLLSDNTTFGHSIPANYVNDTGSKRYWAGGGNTILSKYKSSDYDGLDEYITSCENFNELGAWIRASKELLEIGDLFYLPSVLKLWSHRASSSIEVDEDITFFDSIFSHNKAIKHINKNGMKSDFINVILNLELPYLEKVDYGDLCKISIDEHIHLEKFRDFFIEQFINLSDKNVSGFDEYKNKKITNAIEKGVKSLSSDFKNLARKTSILATGAAVSTVMATLIAVNAEAYEAIAKIIGYGGNTMAYSNILANHLSKKSEKKDSPFYFFWLLNEK